MPTRRACVFGAGVAGSATALRLCRSDWDVVLVAPEPPAPSSCFPHALRGAGYDAAGRLGLLPGLDAVSQPSCDITLVDAAGIPLGVHPRTSDPLLCPGDVAAVLGASLGAVERRNVGVAGLVQDDCGVTVTFGDGGEDWFDLVVGAHGAESALREVAGGERRRRHQAVATVSRRLETDSIGAVFVELAERAVHVHPLIDGSSAVLFTWHGDVLLLPQAVFDDVQWLPAAAWSDVDSAVRGDCSGMHSDRLALGQIALLSEATSCADQLGETTSLAICGAELLGDALDIFTRTDEALVWWEEQMRRTVRRQTTAAWVITPARSSAATGTARRAGSTGRPRQRRSG